MTQNESPGKIAVIFAFSLSKLKSISQRILEMRLSDLQTQS